MITTALQHSDATEFNTQARSQRLSVVVPVYNSERSLPLLAERLAGVLPTLCSDYELILVNDGSRDQSWQVIEKLVQGYSWIQGINMMRNSGQHAALLCGIRAARNPIVVTMDDDLQHPPEELPKLLSKLAEGYDVVYGPPIEEQHGLWRDLSSKIIKMALQSAMGVAAARQVSALRVLRAQVRDAFANYRSPYVSIDVLLTWGTTRFAYVPVRHEARKIGQSNYTLRKLISHALTMVTGFSTAPLRLASWIGFSCTIFGFLVLLWVLGIYFIMGSPAGFPFLASVIAIFGGAQLSALGIIGEYLARMHFRMLDRPPYTVREILGSEASPRGAESLNGFHQEEELVVGSTASYAVQGD